MEMASGELQQLLQVLDERGIAIDREDVALAFQAPESKGRSVQWVQRYLSPHTLLTREERLYYESSANKASLRTASAQHLADEDIEIAVSALEASTAAIEKQCRLLEAQKRAITEIVRRNASDRDNETQGLLPSSHGQREKGQLEFEEAQIAESIRGQVDASTKQATSLIDSIPSHITRAVEKDDRALDGLEKVIIQLVESEGTTDGVDEAQQLCDALRAKLTEDIHLRIDAAYHTASQKQKRQSDKRPDSQDSHGSYRQRENLQAELEELCREIDGLSTMAVENQYRDRITRALTNAKADEDEARASWNGYLDAMLQYMTGRMNALHDHFHHAHAHKAALSTVSKAFGAVLASNSEAKQVFQRSPTKHSQKGLKPLRLVQANLSESQDPVFQMLRALDVRVQDASDAAKLTEGLHAAAMDQHSKMVSQSSRSERGIAAVVAQSLTKAEVDAQSLLRVVFSPSEFGEIHVLRNTTREGIDRLEMGTQNVADEMRALNADGLSRDLQDKQRALLNHLR